MAWTISVKGMIGTIINVTIDNHQVDTVYSTVYSISICIAVYTVPVINIVVTI